MTKLALDIVLLDQRMRGMDAATVLSSMRAAANQTPVIMLVNELDDAVLLTLIRNSVNAIVYKHCPAEKLFEAIDTVSRGLRFVDGSRIDKAFELSAKPQESAGFEVLSSNEKLVATLVAQGLRNREIGERLEMTEGTVKVYLHNIYRKLGIANRTSLALLMANNP